MEVKFLSILQKKYTFSILHAHFYKTLRSIYLFYHLFYLNNNISLIFYYIKQTTTHMAPPIFLSFSHANSLFFSEPSPSFLFSFSLYSFFFFFSRFLKLKPTSLPPSSHRHQQPKLAPVAATHHCDLRSRYSTAWSSLDFILVLVNFGV